MAGAQGTPQLRLLVWLSSLLALGALSRTAEAGPVISVSPTPIVFYGPPLFAEQGAPPGEYQSGWYEVRNVGDATLVVSGMAITGADAAIMAFDGGLDPFCGSGQSCAQTFSLAPGQSRLFPVTCTAAQGGFFTASLGVTSNAAGGASTAAMSCLGLRMPIIQVSPSPLDFGIAHQCLFGDLCGPSCGTRPLDQTLTITNAADPPSRLDFHLTPTLPSSELDDFIVVDMCPQDFPCSVAAGASRSIPITFRPRRTVVHDTPLSLVSQYPGQAPVQIPFYAEGGHGTLAFDTPSFLGYVPVGQTLITSFTVHNSGRSCLSFQKPVSNQPAIELVGTYPDFVELPSGGSYSWTVSCTPSTAEIVSGDLDFELAYEGIDLVTRAVSCQGVAGALEVTPAPVEFVGARAVPLGTSATERVTVRNAGHVTTDLTAITPSDPRFTAALAAGTLPRTLAPGEEVEVEVTFTPTDPARASGTILFEATTASDFTLAVAGEGQRLHLKAIPAEVVFGSIAYPATVAQPVELHNTGDQALTVTTVTLDPPGDFTISGLGPGATIAAGASLGFEVHAEPTVLGQIHAMLAISLDQGPALRIPLDAIAADPLLVVTTTDDFPDDYVADFGGIDLAVGSKISYVTLRNAGAAPIVIGTCTIAGDPELSVLSQCPFTIPGDTAIDLEIAFTPITGSESAATLTVTGAGFATNRLQLRLRGYGVDAPAALLGPDAPAGAPATGLGGGCSTSAPAPGLALGAALLLVLRRRGRGRRR